MVFHINSKKIIKIHNISFYDVIALLKTPENIFFSPVQQHFSSQAQDHVNCSVIHFTIKAL